MTTTPVQNPPSASVAPAEYQQDFRVRLVNVLPILTIHLVCLGVIWVGWSWTAVAVAVALYFVRMFVITAFYHRYFSHRTFSTHRVTQFLAAALGITSAQRGPVWWAAHHREHHRHSDETPDLHSPVQHSMLWSHMGWFLCEEGIGFKEKAVPDLLKYPELRAIERWHVLGPVALALAMFGLGWLLSVTAPQLDTNGWQMLVWGFGISTTVLYHGTFTINSLAHTFGRRRFNTTDDSRNSFLLSLITLGEGWHNNHHYYPGTARQGFYWWEFDPTYYTLLLMSKLGLVWDLRRVPPHVYETAERHARQRAGTAA